MRYKSGIRLFVFLLTSAICGSCGYWIYLWAQSGKLYETGWKAMLVRMIILVIPLILSFVLNGLYLPETGDMEFVAISVSINFFIPIAGTIGAEGEFFGISPKLYCILQIAIPLSLTYLMCLQAILFYNYPPSTSYKSQDHTTPYTYTDPCKDLDSKGLPSGKGY